MRIQHPNPTAGRVNAFGLEFVDGFAYADKLHPERERALLQHQFVIEPDVEVAAPYHPGLGEPFIDLTKLTRAELLDLAEQEHVEVSSRATKAELVEALSWQPAEPVEATAIQED